MIFSMTGFVCDIFEQKWGVLSLNIRSFNHRYRELLTKIPEPFKALEPDIRQLCQDYLKRGKIELSLKLQPSESSIANFSINHALVKKLGSEIEIINKYFKDLKVNAMDILNWSGVIASDTIELSTIKKEILTFVRASLKKLIETREREGKKLKELIIAILKKISIETAKIEKLIPKLTGRQKKKIIDQFNLLKLEIDQTRLAQELVWLIQKADITEELDRIKTYVQETERIVEKGGQVGRRLDFLMQELNREANTICSKSTDTHITQASVEIKILIEQIREQVQNIE